MGTLIAVFIACSDEALPIIVSYPDKAIMILPLLGIKFVYGTLIGFLVDLIYKPHLLSEEDINKDKEEHKDEKHLGCCGHDIDEEGKESWAHEHLLHPLIHSLKIFAYVFVINFIFGSIIYGVGESNFEAFLSSSKYLTPLYATLIGIIPNCASSVIISEMFVKNSLSFGATLAGLCMNAGLGMMVLLKDKSSLKNALRVFLIMFVSSLFIGYLVCLLWTF